MSTSKGGTTLSGYFQEITRRLKAQVDVQTRIIVHPGEMGDNDHLWFADLLRKYLPGRVGVETGFVVNHESDKVSREFFERPGAVRSQDEGIGPQCDVLLVDIQNNAPLCCEQAFRVFPVEMVLGVVEISRFLDARKLAQDLDKIRRVRALADPSQKRYIPSDASGKGLRPLGYVVGLTSAISFDEVMKQVNGIDDRLRLNAVLLLDRALYVRVPHTMEFYKVESDILFQFLAVLRGQIERFPTGAADLGAYLPGVAHLLVSSHPGDETLQGPLSCSLSMQCEPTPVPAWVDGEGTESSAQDDSQKRASSQPVRAQGTDSSRSSSLTRPGQVHTR